jgi:glycosyltransferase involved in cell wall biosynthesis
MIPNLIVPVLNRYDLLQRMLDSVDVPVKHLLIIDNGAGENPETVPLSTLNVSDRFSEVTYLPMPANLGVAGSWNLGIQSFPFDDCWFICSDDVVFSSGALASWHELSSPSAVTVSSDWPHWQFFSVGEEVVQRVGLFDPNFFPANFEDDDYDRRCAHFGVPVVRIDVPHSHVKQGTVHFPGLAEQNHRTYPENETYFHAKESAGDVSAGNWSLSRRRLLHWNYKRVDPGAVE